ncbi:MAG: hypothetical protein L0Z53_05965, partial [Acidobacteriales bacterium]|nr:hypothetical protein [Terriglobales bacterium]
GWGCPVENKRKSQVSNFTHFMATNSFNGPKTEVLFAIFHKRFSWLSLRRGLAHLKYHIAK